MASSGLMVDPSSLASGLMEVSGDSESWVPA